MSDFFLSVGQQHFENKHQEFLPPLIFNTDKIKVFGSESSTCQISTYDKGGSVLSGVLLKKTSGYELINRNTIIKNFDDLSNFEGHFCGLTWNHNEIRIYLDSQGFRPLYYVNDIKNDRLFISTRIDWLAHFLKKNELNLEAFGSYWIYMNQITFEPFLKDISFFKPGFITEITVSDQINLIETVRNSKKEHSDTYDTILNKITNPDSELRSNVSLSGGLDSRTIISLVNGPNHSHAFGNSFNTDMEIAKKVSENLSSDHKEYILPPVSIEENLKQIKDLIGSTSGTMLCHLSDKIAMFKDLNDNGFYMIDGGFGEIHRKQYLSKVLLNQRKGYDSTLNILNKSLLDSKPNFFNQEFYSQIKLNQFEKMKAIWDKSLLGSENDVNKACDIFSFETRVKNTTRYQQAWYDKFFISYMPFIQESVIDATFELPDSQKNNGVLFRSFIRKKRGLDKILLTKGDIKYPFSTPSLLFKVYLHFYKQLFKQKKDSSITHFLLLNKEFILDTLNSKSTRECPYYDYELIKKEIESFYRKPIQNELFVIYWLNFELLRNRLSLS